MLGIVSWFIFHLPISVKINFSKASFKHTISVPYRLDPNQARQKSFFVGPDLDPNCFQRLSLNDKIRHLQAKCKDLDFSMSRLFIL